MNTDLYIFEEFLLKSYKANTSKTMYYKLILNHSAFKITEHMSSFNGIHVITFLQTTIQIFISSDLFTMYINGKIDLSTTTCWKWFHS